MSRRKLLTPAKRTVTSLTEETCPFDASLLQSKLNDIKARFVNDQGTYNRFDELVQTLHAYYLWGSSEEIPILEELFGKRKINSLGPYTLEWFTGKIAGWRLYYRSDLDTARYDTVVRLINAAARLLNNGLEVKTSENPAAGNGLFTTRHFPKGTILTEYGGYLSSVDALECLGLPDTYRQYVLALPGGSGHILDAQIYFRLGYDMGRWPNSIEGTSKIANARFNFIKRDGDLHTVIEAVEDLRAGEEVLLDYGNKFKLT